MTTRASAGTLPCLAYLVGVQQRGARVHKVTHAVPVCVPSQGRAVLVGVARVADAVTVCVRLERREGAQRVLQVRVVWGGGVVGVRVGLRACGHPGPSHSCFHLCTWSGS